MKFKFKNLLLLILITFDLFLFIDVVNLYNANYVGRFNITDPASLYIVINRQNHKDNMFLSYQDTVIGLSYDKVKLLEFALIFNIYEIDYYIDYTMYEHINLKIKNFSINSMGGAYIIEALNFNFIYVHNADEINFTYVLQRVDKIDVLKINCVDETLFKHPLFSKPIYNLVIDKCSISDKLLESLYEEAIDIYVLTSKTLLVKYKNNLLSIMELPL
jgi:hypothetical protein